MTSARCRRPTCGTRSGGRALRAVTLGGLRPLRPADISTPGSMITVIPEGYQDDDDALAKAGVILIKFEPGQMQRPDRL